MLSEEKLALLQREYARLAVREGVNLQSGQRVVLSCPVERADFARLCAEEAYAAGAAEVLLRWRDDALTRLKYLHGAEAVFDRMDPWEAEMHEAVSAEGAAWLYVAGEDPRNLDGVAPDRIRRARISRGNAIRGFRDRQGRNEFPWCVCSAPTAAWARTVFPGLPAAEAENRLWEEIFRACRVRETGSVEAWRAHSETLRRRTEHMNALDLCSLRYRNALGTDLTVALPEGHFWAGGAEKCRGNGVWFSANIPTEEIFTLPRRDGVEGVVYASKPLVYDGTVIEGLRFTLREGRIVEAEAAQGREVLRGAIQVDEGASYFGEVALVPYSSPISDSGILFYETLFDENASCHFAFGEAYPACIKGGDDLSPEELKEAGINAESNTHVDFMVGTSDLEITGKTRDGRIVKVFENGNFAI